MPNDRSRAPHGKCEEGRARLFRRARHLDHPQMAADHLRRRGRDLHRRSRPGRGAGAGPAQGRDARHPRHPYRGPARGVRPRLRLPDDARERPLRGRLPARHLDRPAAHRQAPGRDRPTRPAPTRSPTAPPARATTRSASSSPPMRSTPTSRSSRPGASGISTRAPTSLDFAEKHKIPVPKDKRGEAPFSVDANLLHSRTRARCSRIRGASRRADVFQRTVAPEDAPDKRDAYVEIDVRERRPGRRRRQGDEPGALLDRASTSSAASTASAASTSSRTASSA